MWTNLADSDGDRVNTGPSDPNNLGGFANYGYWSSTAYDIYASWDQNFINGTENDTDKASGLRVRAVWAF